MVWVDAHRHCIILLACTTCALHCVNLPCLLCVNEGCAGLPEYIACCHFLTLKPCWVQARARGISAADCSEISILTAFHNKVLEQKVMVGKVIDTCQSRLLSWSLSSSQLIQTAKEAAAPPPRTCPNHPNGCPKPGTLVQPQAAAQPQAVATKVAAQSQPQGSTAQAQTSPAATPPSASARGVSKQAAQPKAVAGATATSTEHLQSAADRQKQLDDKYAAINAQQAVVQPGTPPPPPAASSSKDDGELALARFPVLYLGL